MVTIRGLIDKCHRWVGFKNHQFVGMLASMLGGLSTHPSYDHTLAPLILLAPAQHTIKPSIHGHILLTGIPRFNATSPRARFNTRGSVNPSWNRNNPSRKPPSDLTRTQVLVKMNALVPRSFEKPSPDAVLTLISSGTWLSLLCVCSPLSPRPDASDPRLSDSPGNLLKRRITTSAATRRTVMI